MPNEIEPNNGMNNATTVALGGTITGQRSSDADYDWYVVSVNSPTGVDISFDPSVDDPNYKRSQVSVYTSGGVLIAAAESGQDLSYHFNAGSAGSYYVLVGPNVWMGGDFNPYNLTVTSSALSSGYETESNDSLASANTVTLGNQILGQVANGNADYYVASLSSPGVLHVALDIPSNPYSAGYYVNVFDQSGVSLATYALVSDKTIDVGAPSAGNYYVSISGNGFYNGYGNGNEFYGVTLTATAGGASGLESEGNNTSANADVVAVGNTIQGQLASNVDQDWYSVTVGSSECLTFTLNAQNIPASSDYFQVTVFDANGNVLASKEGGGGTSYQLNLSSGIYSVEVVSAQWWSQAPYTLLVTGGAVNPALEVETNNTLESANSLVLGASLSGFVSHSDIDYYVTTFATTGNTLNISLAQSGDPITVMVFDPQGTVIANSLVSQSSTSFDVAVPGAGNYAVAVSAGSPASNGIYELTVNAGNDDWTDDFAGSTATTGNLGTGGSRTGVINIANDADWFTINLQDGVPFNINLSGTYNNTSGLADPVLKIYDSSGNLLQINDDDGSSSNSHILFTPIAPGTYYVAASGKGAGTYVLSAVSVDDFSADKNTTGVVTPGSTYGYPTSGAIDYSGDVDWLRVSLTAGQTYVFSAEGNNPSNLDLTLSLYTPDGHLVEQVDDVEAVVGGAFQTLTAPQIGFTAPSSGIYYLAVDGKGATGAYNVSAQSYTAMQLASDLYSGASWTGSIGFPTSVSYYFTPSLPPENAPYVSGFSPFTAAQQADVLQIFNAWGSLANVSFSPGSSYYTSDITFQWLAQGPGIDSNTAALTYIQPSGSQLQYTDVVVSSGAFSPYQDPVPGDFLYVSIMHEIGHALGLDHPGNYDGVYPGHAYLPYPLDNTQFTVMSYLDKLDSVSENLLPGLLDIAAIQYIYGPNLSYRTGNDTYSFPSANEYLGTIWDAGGIDTLDASNQSFGATLFLTAGTLSSIGSNGSGSAAHDNVGIAFGASIENASGGSGDDYIVGNGLANTLKGNGGNDLIIGGNGNDTIDGGMGSDTVIYSGSVAQYTVTKSGTSFVVTSNSTSEGIDTLTDVEYLQFSDGERRLGTANLDFDGDGKSDILWHNSSSGSNGVWFSANSATGQSLASSSLLLAGIGDFDGDGKSDLLWRNLSTGANTIWKSGNSATVQTTAAMSDLAWAVVGVGDFNGDGKSDILWRNGATGANTIWKSGDSANVQATTTQADLAWSVAGIGDFNGDGKSDILWRNSSTGANTVWKSGDSADAQTLTAFNDAAWSIAGIADFNGDGQSDILWRNSSSGANTLWKSGDGGNSQSLGVLSGAAWQVVGLGDYDGDGKSDILWRNNSTGADVIWKSGDSATTQSVSTLADTTWTAPAQTNSWASNSAPPPTNHAHFDFNGDGKSDILWHNIASGANGIWLGGNSASGLNVSSSTWQLAGVGDFNGDGKSDILWRNATTGANTIWKSANSADVQTTSAVADLAWGVVGVGDFDGDGKSDILWRNGNTGANTIWKSGDSSTIQTTTSQSNPWFVSGIGDFDGDGKSDILWRNGSTGANTIWKSGNSATVQAVATQNDPWTVAGVGDFDGDGKSDILWRNLGTGANTLWKSGNSATSQTLGALSGIAWQVVGTGDYDGDGKSDILWRNTSTGTENIWHNGDSTDVIPVSTLASNMWTAPAQTDTWASNTSSSKPESDFNGDGKSDILWRNTSSGSTAVWMSGNSGAGFSLTLMADKNWQIAGTGDFDGDGKADILWRNLSTGAGAIWKSGDSTTTQAVGTVADLNWKIVGVGDMNDDGKSDIFWRNTSTGATAVWLSGNNGAGYNLTAMADQAWQIAGVGDFDGDGKADLLWHNFSTGASSIWKNGDSTTVQVVGTVADLNWKIVGVGDMNSDGKSDILWRNSSSGSNGVWMSGNNGAGYGLTAMVDQAWQVAAVGDFDGDGKSDILWRNSSTGAQTIWKSGDSTTTQSVATLNDQNWQVAIGQESGDLLQGGVGNNTLWGTSGADFLYGREGNDQLTGGAGNDSFVFNTALNGITNVDVITDFTAGSDQIVLDHLVFTSLVAGALPGGDLVVEAGVVAHDANDFLLYDSANGNLYYDADGSGVGAPTLFATLSNHPAITATDFHVI